MKAFLQFVEIRTKVASVMPFILGTLMALYLDLPFNTINFLLMFGSLLCVDMGTTGLNHYMDAKRAVLKEGYHYEEHNPVSKGVYSEVKAKRVLISLFTLATALGLVLAYRSGWVVLVLGGASFIVALMYSMGPLPISRTPLGEIFSGGIMGGIIPFTAFYIHAYALVPIEIEKYYNFVKIGINFSLMLPIIILSIPYVLLISNIMLANNICDHKEDIVNQRYTLPVIMGVSKTLILYKANVILAYTAVIIGVIFGVLSPVWLMALLSFPILLKQTALFTRNPIKGETFLYAVKNFMIWSMAMNIILIVLVIIE